MKDDLFSKIKEPIFYVTPDPARAVGLEKVLSFYHIICLDNSPLVDLLIAKGVRVFSLEAKIGKENTVLRNTGMILAHPLVQEYIAKNARNLKPNILFFKPSKKIEAICQRKGWRALGASPELNQQFEDKVSFYRLCQSLNISHPPGEIKILKRCHYQDLSLRFGQKLVIQFGHGWAGNTTYFVKNKSDFVHLQAKFPEREVRITCFIKGRTVLNNACVTGKKIFISPPALQITALEEFTQNPGGTCGRQWPARLKEKIRDKIEEYSQIIGEKMRDLGYKGFFGLDFLVEDKTDKVYISENNARLTASVPLYTKMELKAGQTPLLLYHILEYLKKAYPQDDSRKVKEMIGGELIMRNNTTASVRVTGEFPPGIYSYKREHLTYLREGYSLEDISERREFFILAASGGRIITPENEIARLNSLEEILDEEGQIKSFPKKALLEVKRELIL
ncbi:MAG: ATP-grasp domain-containing protein [Patescibacteria group bacterium]